MPPRGRRSVPDNLDPLVDTLSNVVGILVIVVALTQIQLGDALARVAELDFLRMGDERTEDLDAELAAEFAARRDALLRRTDVGVEASIRLASKALDTLSRIGMIGKGGESRSMTALFERLKISQDELREKRNEFDLREKFAGQIQRVPKKLLARLPDPQIMRGKESWIFARHGRIYLADRKKLFDHGQRAIARVLGLGSEDGNRQVRPDEFEAIARYLRKRDVGVGSFRWRLKTQPDIRIALAWRSSIGGLGYPELGSASAMRSWLAARSPEIDFIQFHVWGDSFEAYLVAREMIESAGFRAGWRAYEIGDEIELPIRFGRAAPEVGPILVD